MNQNKSNIWLRHASRWMTFFAILVLGLSAGASLAEATLLVPFWKTLSGNDFFGWYQDNKARLVAFYSPMQIWSAVLALSALVLQWLSRSRGKWMMLASTFFALAVLGTFFLYFKAANTQLAADPMPDAQLLASLNEWEVWQWIRIGLATLAFCFATWAGSSPGTAVAEES